MQNVTTESGEDEINVAVLSSLLQFDESLRCGRPTAVDFSSLPPELREQLELGHSAIRELEAAIPRQDSVMPSWAPRKIGRFDIQSVLGAGGFAVVYLSYDSRLNRPVAVKVPRPHALIQPELRKRFAKEAQAAARLDHPNILPIYEAGEDGDLLYIVSALCEGPTLEDWLASRTCLPDPKLAAEIVRQLADALNYSHEHGVLHRDLKPGNVLLFPTDRLVETEFPFQARISDFGLAKVLDDPQLDIVSSQLMGTPRFMAPELLAGNSRTSSVASDIYSLGVILYTMLTGNAPFCSVSLAETMRQIASEDPISPDLINRSAGKDLSLICLRCLEKSPKSRYLSAGELRDDLDRYLTGQCVHARETPWFLRVRKWCRRYPLKAALAILSSIFVLITAAIIFRYTYSLRRLQDELLHSNHELSLRVTELNNVAQIARTSQQQADQERTHARDMQKIADLNLASRTWQQGDARGAETLLRPWIDAGLTVPAQRTPADVALSYLWKRITVASSTVGTFSQAIWWLHADSESGKLVMAGSAGKIELATLETSRNEATGGSGFLKAATGELSCVTLSDDRTLAASSGDDGSVKIWRLETTSGLTIESFQPSHEIQVLPHSGVLGAFFLPGTHQIVTCARTPTVTIWDGDSGMKIRDVATSHLRFIESMAISPDGSELATAGADGLVEIFRLSDWTSTSRIQASSRAIAKVTYSSDSEKIVCGGGDRLARLYDLRGGNLLAQYETLAGITGIVCNPMNEVLVADRDGILTILKISPEMIRSIPGESVPSWQPVRRWAGHDVPISSICWVPDSTSSEVKASWVSADRNGTVRRWSVEESPSNTSRLPNAEAATEIPVLLPCHSLWLRSTDQVLELLDTKAGKVVNRLPTSSRITSIVHDDSTGVLLAGDADGNLYEIRENAEEFVLTRQIAVAPATSLIRLFPASDGRTVCVIDGNWNLAVVDRETGTIRSRFRQTLIAVMLPDREHFIRSLAGTNVMEVVSIRDGNVCRTLKGHQSTISRIVITPDGQTCITTSHDRTVRLWNISDWTERQELRGHSSPIIAMAMTQSGRLFATADESGVIKLWDTESARELTELDEHAPLLLELKFNHDASQLIGWDAEQRIYSMSL